MNKIRQLTRKEQLEWYLKFLYEQREKINKEVELVENDLKRERKKENEK